MQATQQSTITPYTSRKWQIKTINGLCLIADKGQLKLAEKISTPNALWQFRTGHHAGLYQIYNSESGEVLIDSINGGHDEWFVEPCYQGYCHLVSPGGLFRHFESRRALVQGRVSRSFVEYENWYIT